MYQLTELSNEELEQIRDDILLRNSLPSEIAPCYHCVASEDECALCKRDILDSIEDELDNRGIDWSLFLQ